MSKILQTFQIFHSQITIYPISNIVGGSGGNGVPNEQGSNGGNGGNGIIIINPLVLNLFNFPSGGRGKFAGNGGDGGIGGKFVA